MSDRITSYPFFQEAYFVNDLDESIHKWSDQFGAGPFRKAMHHQTDRFHYRGTDQEADVYELFALFKKQEWDLVLWPLYKS